MIVCKKKKKKKKKRSCRIEDFAISVAHRVKVKENEKRDKYLDLARKQKKKKAIEYEGDGDIYCNSGTSWDYLIYSIVKIGQNTENSPRDLKRLAITQNPVNDHQLKLVRKTARSNIIVIIKTK